MAIASAPGMKIAGIRLWKIQYQLVVDWKAGFDTTVSVFS